MERVVCVIEVGRPDSRAVFPMADIIPSNRCGANSWRLIFITEKLEGVDSKRNEVMCNE
jgi:hypothetical protein